VRVTGEQVLSVVIATHDAAQVIATCLDALSSQDHGPPLEIIVADSSSDETDRIVRERFPHVQVHHTDDALAIAQLRALGIARATGAIVAILDPYSVAAPDWARRVLAAHAQQPAPIIGGAVGLHEPDTRTLLDWTLYFNEYGLFMPPASPGPVTIVPGSNVSYKRAVLFDGDRPRYGVFWKTFVNRESELQGKALWLDPSIRVDLNKPIPFLDFLRTRYLHGRCFAGMRIAGQPWTARAARAATTPLLPFLQLARWTRGFWPKRTERARYALTVPLQLLLFAAWAWGELWGYLLGVGDTCRRLHY
jgi:glycosyltransferase involved in cell wall biosynthesis